MLRPTSFTPTLLREVDQGAPRPLQGVLEEHHPTLWQGHQGTPGTPVPHQQM